MIVIKVTLWITIINFVVQFKNTFMLSVWNLSLVVLIVSSLITVQYFYKQSFFLQLLNLTHTFFVKLNFPLSFLYVTIETLLSHFNSNVRKIAQKGCTWRELEKIFETCCEGKRVRGQRVPRQFFNPVWANTVQISTWPAPRRYIYPSKVCGVNTSQQWSISDQLTSRPTPIFASLTARFLHNPGKIARLEVRRFVEFVRKDSKLRLSPPPTRIEISSISFGRVPGEASSAPPSFNGFNQTT